MNGSKLQQILSRGEFAVTAEVGPPRGADAGIVRSKAKHLAGYVDAVNVTDNQTAIVRMSSLAACVHLMQMGFDPVLQMVTRDRNRIALQSDILGAYSLGIRNVLCLSGDHQTFGSQPGALNVYDIAVAIGGNPSPSNAALTIVGHMYDYAFVRFELGYASAISFILFLMNFVLGQIFMKILSTKDE